MSKLVSADLLLKAIEEFKEKSKDKEVLDKLSNIIQEMPDERFEKPAIEYDEIKVAKLSLTMYDMFFNELTTAMGNTLHWWRQAQFSLSEGQTIYYQGKVDAYREFLDRLEKERDLAKSSLEYCVAYEDKDYIARSIKFHKNIEVDDLLPDDKYRGTREYNRIQQLKGKIANLLEGYAHQGFQLGVRYVKQRFLDEKFKNYKKFDRKELERDLINHLPDNIHYD